MVKGYFTFKLAGLLTVQGAGFIAMERYQQAQEYLSKAGVKDAGLDAYLTEHYRPLTDHQKEVLEQSRLRSFDLPWRPLPHHPFPTALGRLPPGAEELHHRWRTMLAQGGGPTSANSAGEFPVKALGTSLSTQATSTQTSVNYGGKSRAPVSIMDSYMRKVAIESNHVEETFRVIPENVCFPPNSPLALRP